MMYDILANTDNEYFATFILSAIAMCVVAFSRSLAGFLYAIGGCILIGVFSMMTGCELVTPQDCFIAGFFAVLWGSIFGAVAAVTNTGPGFGAVVCTTILLSGFHYYLFCTLPPWFMYFVYFFISLCIVAGARQLMKSHVRNSNNVRRS
jgi:hypothetical protein